MLEWVSNNSAFVSAATSLLMVGIWAAYLQLFYFTYKGQRRPVVLINRALGIGRDGHCLISNMSAAPVYILSIFAVLEEDGASWVCTVTDDEDISERPGASEQTHQGPLLSGGFMDVGLFEEMVRRARTVESAATGAARVEEASLFTAIEVVVIALYGSSRRFIGASRRFELIADGDQLNLRPASLETEQLAGFRDRGRMKRLLREHLYIRTSRR